MSQVKENYEAFVKQLPSLLRSHSGKFALMHDAEIIHCFDTAGDAYWVGLEFYGEGNFSIQEVTGTPVYINPDKYRTTVSG